LVTIGSPVTLGDTREYLVEATTHAQGQRAAIEKHCTIKCEPASGLEVAKAIARGVPLIVAGAETPAG
jgi:hypothetical protein